MEDLNDMYLFAKVVEHGGYTAASRALGIVTSRLSRRIAELEQQLGVRLLNRTTRSISLTDAGETFHRHCVAVVGEAEAAREAIERTRSAPQGLVRFSCPVAVLQSTVGRIVARYLADNPMVRVNIEATNRRVHVVEDGLDLALRIRLPPLEDSELALRKIGVSETVFACSPWFLAQHGSPRALQDLSNLPTLSQGRPGDRFSWSGRASDGTDLSVAITPRLVTDDLFTLRVAALEGVGIAQMPRELIRDELARGQLVRVLTDIQLPSAIVHVVFPSRRGLIPAVRGLIDALAADFEAADLPS